MGFTFSCEPKKTNSNLCFDNIALCQQLITPPASIVTSSSGSSSSSGTNTASSTTCSLSCSYNNAGTITLSANTSTKTSGSISGGNGTYKVYKLIFPTSSNSKIQWTAYAINTNYSSTGIRTIWSWIYPENFDVKTKANAESNQSFVLEGSSFYRSTSCRCFSIENYSSSSQSFTIEIIPAQP